MEIIQTVKLDNNEKSTLVQATEIFTEICESCNCDGCPLDHLRDEFNGYCPDTVLRRALNKLGIK